MGFLVTYKNEEDQIKRKALESPLEYACMVFDPLTPFKGHQFDPRVISSMYPGLLLIPFNLICHMIMFRKLDV